MQQFLSTCREFPPRKSFATFQIVRDRHQRVQNAGVVTMPHDRLQGLKCLKGLMCCQLFGIKNTHGSQVARNGFANIRQVLQSAWSLV
ncbi:MAG: hypothetical protein A3H24_07665 [Rhodoferax sp. RIFCSPLOWO2_12_FULL_60_11]|nr:MAG: hypothetical protein A3H24_07665 [Rhodoferax sp. RIFCSPLOWO2_12_FULL_60_11]